jgi:hypothetical protein
MPDRAQQIPLLTEGLLEQLAARWRTHGLLIVESLRPGLSDAEMDELTEPLGIVLPREARTWWRWHDGASTEGGGSCNLGPLRLYSPLSDAVRNTVAIRETMRGVDGELDPAWRYSWLTMNSGGHTTVIDCGVGFEEAVPARYYRFEEPETGAEGVPSMGALVLLYIDAFDRGLWSFDRVRGTWSSDRSKLDAVTRDLHLT